MKLEEMRNGRHNKRKKEKRKENEKHDLVNLLVKGTMGFKDVIYA